jgi:hypothetical protein
MNEDFIEVWIPSLKRFESFKYINNLQYKAICKHFASPNFSSIQWKTGFLKCIFNIIHSNHVKFYETGIENISFVDAFIVAMNMKTASVDGRMQFNLTCDETGNAFKTTITLNDMEKNILELGEDFFQNLPKFSFELKDFSDFSIIIQQTHFPEKSLKEVDEIPAKISQKIFKEFVQKEKIAQKVSLFKIESPFSSKVQFQQNFSLFPEAIVMLFKMIFEENLFSIYQMYWHSVREIKLDSKMIDEMTPIELRSIYFKLYKTEIEKNKKEDESQRYIK